MLLMPLIVRRGLKVMGKLCGRGNERLEAKALAMHRVAEGEGGGSKISPDLPACVSLFTSLFMYLTFHKKGYVTHAFWNSAA